LFSVHLKPTQYKSIIILRKNFIWLFVVFSLKRWTVRLVRYFRRVRLPARGPVITVPIIASKEIVERENADLAVSVLSDKFGITTNAFTNNYVLRMIYNPRKTWLQWLAKTYSKKIW
jgi:hypothetical protein